jgi:hypothetical protein
MLGVNKNARYIDLRIMITISTAENITEDT